jgi:hypothetical protein
MDERDDAIGEAMERIGRSAKRVILRALTIESELTPLSSRDHPVYELIRAQHGIAEVRRRMNGR